MNVGIFGVYDSVLDREKFGLRQGHFCVSPKFSPTGAKTVILQHLKNRNKLAACQQYLVSFFQKCERICQE